MNISFQSLQNRWTLLLSIHPSTLSMFHNIWFKFLWEFLVAGDTSALWHKDEASVGQDCEGANWLGEQHNHLPGTLVGAALETAAFWHGTVRHVALANNHAGWRIENCRFNKTETVKTSKGKRPLLSGTDGRPRSSWSQRMVERYSRYLSLLSWVLSGQELIKTMHRQDHISHSKGQCWRVPPCRIQACAGRMVHRNPLLKILFPPLGASSGAGHTGSSHNVSSSVLLIRVTISSLQLASKCIRSG